MCADEDWKRRIDSGEYDAILEPRTTTCAARAELPASQNAAGSRPIPGNTVLQMRRSRAPANRSAGRGCEELSLLDSLPQTSRRQRHPATVGEAVTRAFAEFVPTIRPSVPAWCWASTDARCDCLGSRSTGTVPASDKEQTFQDAITRRWAGVPRWRSRRDTVTDRPGAGSAAGVMAAPVPGQSSKCAHAREIAWCDGVGRGDRDQGDRGWKRDADTITGGPNLERHQKATLAPRAARPTCQ